MIKPTDIYTYIERRHADGGWRLVFFEFLWVDARMDIKGNIAHAALGDMGQRLPDLFQAMTQVGDGADSAPMTEDSRYLFPGMPAPRSPWMDDAAFLYKTTGSQYTSWFWLDGLHVVSDRHEAFDTCGALGRWRGRAIRAMKGWKSLGDLFEHSWDPKGRGLIIADNESPMTLISAHEALQMKKDARGLLDPCPENFRFTFCFDGKEPV